MSYTISIRKEKRASLNQKKITSEEFRSLVYDSNDLIWLENAKVVNEDIKRLHLGDVVAIWEIDSENYLWIELNRFGTIDFGYKPWLEVKEIKKKIVEIAACLNCYVESDDGKILFSPQEL